MRVLIYKRTHKGDPCERGVFGINGCMRRFRNKISYDAVIGIGGNRPDKGHEEIRHKINWIGLKPRTVGHRQTYCRGDRKYQYHGFQIVFRHFALLEEKGENLPKSYKNLYEYMYDGKRRSAIVDTSKSCYSKALCEEIEKIVRSIENSPASKGYFPYECKSGAVPFKTTPDLLRFLSTTRGKTSATSISSCGAGGGSLFP